MYSLAHVVAISILIKATIEENGIHFMNTSSGSWSEYVSSTLLSAQDIGRITVIS